MKRVYPILVLVAVTLAGAAAIAADPTRVLNGHEFMPSEVVRSPFAISHFATITGGGMAFNVKTPFIDVDGNTIGTLEGDVAFMALGFEYQQRFGNWFAARVGFGGGARLGIDEQSVLAQGVNGTYVQTFGGIGRILQTEKVILSGALDFKRTNVVGLDPYGFAQNVVEGGLEEDNDLVSSGGVNGGTLSALAGWAPRDWLGINGYVDFGPSQYTEGESKTQLGGGLAVGGDLKNLDLVPLGLNLLVSTSSVSAAGADLADRYWAYGLGVLFTGWDDFSLGFEATMNTYERRSGGDDFNAFVGTINLRYWPK